MDRCNVLNMVVTRYTELTGCRLPVQQAPMGSVSTAALAVAVADAGESAAAITSVEPAAAILEAWSAGL